MSASLSNVWVSNIDKMDECKFEGVQHRLQELAIEKGISFLLVSHGDTLTIIASSSPLDGQETKDPKDLLSSSDSPCTLDGRATNEESISFRVSPKVVLDNNDFAFIDLHTVDPVLEQIEKGDYVIIGDSASSLIASLLSVAVELKKFLYSWYEDNEQEAIRPKRARQRQGEYYGIPIKLLDDVKDKIVGFLDNSEILGTELLPPAFRKPVHSVRYAGILSKKIIRDCYKTVSMVHKQAKMLKKYVLDDLDGNYIYLKGPIYPFSYGQSNYSNMVFVASYDMLMLDFDIQPGFSKDNAVQVLERFLESQAGVIENERLFKRTPCFKIYETDNGVHAFLLSEFIPHNTDKASRIMIEVCSDLNYAAMTRMKGYSVRLTPKIYVNRKYVEKEYVKTQFIQREGLEVNRELVTYVGDRERCIPYIEDYANMLLEMQKYIMSHNYVDIYDAMFNRDKDVIDRWGDHLSGLYRNLRDRHPKMRLTRDTFVWSRDANERERIEKLEF